MDNLVKINIPFGIKRGLSDEELDSVCGAFSHLAKSTLITAYKEDKEK